MRNLTSPLPLQEAQVQSLVGKLRSCLLHGVIKKKKRLREFPGSPVVKTLCSHTLGHDSDLIDLDCGLVFRIFFKLFKSFSNSPDAAKILNHGPNPKW